MTSQAMRQLWCNTYDLAILDINNFTINATVVNSSPSTIRLSPVCDEKPLADNVVKNFKGVCHV
jgi:hypothetical protein